MIIFSAVIILVSVFEMYSMIKNNQKREIIVFLCIALGTWIFGILYMMDPYSKSFVSIIMDALKIDM